MKKTKLEKRIEAEQREADKRSPSEQLEWLDKHELRALKERSKLADKLKEQ